MNKALAVVGMCGTGKSVVTEFLKQRQFELFYFGGVVLEEVKARNLEVIQANEKIVREDLRKEYGMAAMAILLCPKIEKALETGNAVLDGLYSWEEYKYLKEKLGDKLILLSVVSDAEERYKRLSTREVRPLTREEAIKRDHTELETLDKGGPIAIADYFIYNNGTEEDLKQRVLDILEKI